ncbi:MAG TPA: acyl carrier protein [Thermoanaerobaculia bacterium]|nr:acyl carrier protein [Thermoanaerobaculia bacterium]
MARVKAWLLSVNREAGDVGWDTDLIAERVLDSLQMVNFLLYIEEVRGREIGEQMIRPECFQSLRAIYDNFFRT